MRQIIRYLLEGLAVSIAGYLIGGRRVRFSEIGLIGLVSALTLMVLDFFAPRVSVGFQQGSGFGFGSKQLNMIGGGENRYLASNPESQNNQTNIIPNQQLHDVELQKLNYQKTAKQEMSTNTEYIANLDDFAEKPTSQTKDFPVSSMMANSKMASLYDPIRTTSRWMDWNIEQKPLNDNVSEYRIMPGYYSKYIIQPGYNEKVKTSNFQQIDQLSPVMWSTKNPIDRNYFLMTTAGPALTGGPSAKPVMLMTPDAACTVRSMARLSRSGPSRP